MDMKAPPSAQELRQSMIDELKEALWKEYVEQEKPTFGTVFERAKARRAFEEGVGAGMELERHLSSPSLAPSSSG